MNLDSIVVKSRNPIYYIDDKYQIIEVSNVYDDEEVIEIKSGDVGVNRVPINKRITIIPALGMFLFKTKDDALMFGRLLSREGKTSLIKSAESQGITKENVLKIHSGVVKNGLYSIKELDDGLLNRKSGYCYLDGDEIKTIPQIVPGSQEDVVVTEYVNRSSKLDSINLANNKVLFELCYENGETYITYYTIDSNVVSTTALFVSDLNSFKVFDSKFNARAFKNSVSRYGAEHVMNQEINKRESYEKYKYNQQVRRETTKKVFTILWNFIWNYKGVILGKGLDIIKKKLTKSDTNTEIQNKIIDMINKGEVNLVN